ncbi:hypothetical protein OESDEN_08878 [Oesophagostomum dentatum]|uniref:Peptidase M1 membrane alanine aminopeptidase domain-containing protein n=1 Tax=Oesophagostomum dentatum TaxID=61180 RepID=A0A0B1T641_OESDE|nr:hypothetical protein OESDEN_08878 [Oesophagostomum dentatum]
MSDYGVDAGVKCLDYFDDLYKHPFPLKKQDMFALPDHSWDAMENWGLVTYRFVIYQDDCSSSTW